MFVILPAPVTRHTPTPQPRTYTVAEVAELFGLHPQSVYAAAARGELPAMRFGRRWVFPREAIDAMLKTGRRTTNATRILRRKQRISHSLRRNRA
jgi:excisionase family DNA binding protein